MGELNRGPAEQSEAKSNVAVAERGEHDGLQQFRLAANDDKSAGGGPGAGAQDRLPPLSIESSKYGAAASDTLPPLRDCPSYEPGVFGAELVPECRIYPPIKDAEPARDEDSIRQQLERDSQDGSAREHDPVKAQIMMENQPGAAGKYDPVKAQIMMENQPGAAGKYDPVKAQIMMENQPGAAGKYDPVKAQIVMEDQPGGLPQQNRVGRSVPGGDFTSW